MAAAAPRHRRRVMDMMMVEREKQIRRRRKQTLKTAVLTAAVALAVTVSAFAVFGSFGKDAAPGGRPGNADAPGTQTQTPLPPEPTPEELAAQEATQAEELLARADFMAQGYDFDGASDLIRSFSGPAEEYPELAAALSRYADEQAQMVRWADPTTVPHVFFHSLIVDTDRAFDSDYTNAGYNLYMTTVYEFERMLDEMYARGYVLVNIQDIAKTVTDDNGKTKYAPGDIMLPEGKRPFIMSQDDVNYYEYMIDGDGDHFPDKDGDGFATRIVIGEDGYPTCEYITATGELLTGDYDLVPILEKFIQRHPDFSYRGARAILGVTGYEGVFGYRTHPDWEVILGKEAWAKEKVDAIAVSECLKEHGWVIASHSFGHPAYGQISNERVIADVQKWEDQVQPIVGDTEVFIYPFGSDIAGIGAYSGVKYDAMYAAGYRYFCNVDSSKYWVQIRDDYVRQGRRNLDGYRMYWNPDKLSDLFDVAQVFDPARPTPVPAL